MITMNDCKQAKEYDFKGLSTDEKPTNCDVNSLFYELDTGDFYYFDGVWKKVGSKVQLQDTGNSGTIEITENDVYDLTDYDYADVNVPGVVPVGTLPILENGTADVTSYATAEVDVDYATVNFNLPLFKKTFPIELSQARGKLAATSVGNYALFGGGNFSTSYYNVVDAYDTTLTRTIPTGLSVGRNDLAATTIGNYALFGGGNKSGYYVDVYDMTLTRGTPTDPLSQTRSGLAATTIGNYALFGGGWTNSGYRSNVVDAYDTTLTRTTPTELSQARNLLTATSIVPPAGNSTQQSGYALFGGGWTGSGSNVVDAYDVTLTRTTPTALTVSRRSLAATSVSPAGNSAQQSGYALFGGGYSYYTLSTVNAYDADLTRTTPTSLSQSREYLAATSVAPAGGSSPQSGYALFGGGDSDSTRYATVDAYDATLTRTIPTGLSIGRNYLAATTIGNYALFGGGNSDSSSSNVVDAYNPYHNIQVFPDTKYSFNGSAEQISFTWETIAMQGPVVGYIKIKNTTVT